MENKNFMKFLILLPMIFLFIPSMYIPKLRIPVYDIIIGITFLVFILSNKNLEIFKQIINYIKIKHVKILILYVSWVILSGIILVLLGKYNFFYALYSIFILFLYNDFLWFFYPSIIYPRFVNLKIFIKFLLIGIYVICIYGLVIYFFDLTNISILHPIHYVIVNRRLSEDYGIASARVLSVFEEPGYFGGFLCINLPIIYSTIFSKYRILKNKTLNILFKNTYIPILWLTIIFIQSPIWLLLCLISTLIYYKKHIFNYIKKYAIVIMFVLGLFLLILGNFSFNSEDISNTFLGRIEKTVSSICDINELVRKEPSLANRVLSYIVRVKIFLANPIVGIGYKNTEYNAKEVFYNLKYPLTQETINNLAKPDLKMGMNGAIFWDILSDCGFVGIILFYTFLLFLIKYMNKFIKIMEPSIYKNFALGLKGTYISILLLSLYDIRPNFHYFWFLFGIANGITIYRKIIKHKF